MLKRKRWMLGFSIIYWLTVILGIILISVAFKKVPLQAYGLRAYFFSPTVDPTYYTPGLYHIGVGYYFITFPSSKQYLSDQKVFAINQNLQKVEVTYSLCYRIDPNRIYNLYQTMGHDYEQYVIAAINNIISGVFLTVGQSSSRATVQALVITSINNNNDKISVVLNSAVVVEGLWINELAFSEQIQKSYSDSLFLSDAYQESYETTQLEYQKKKLEVNAITQQMALTQQQFVFQALQLYNSRFSDVVASDLSSEQERQTKMGYFYQMKRIWTYYNSTKMIFN